MIAKDQYSKIISSPNFIKAQLKFQADLYNKINKECKHEIPQSDDYQICYKKQKRKIKHFTLFTQLLFDKRQQNLKKIIKQQCQSKLADSQKFLQCFEDRQNRYLSKFINNDIKYLSKLRQELLNS